MSVLMEVESHEHPLSDTDINWDKLDKTRFHLIGNLLFTLQQAILHPTHLLKTRLQIQHSQSQSQSRLFYILKKEGISSLYRGFATSAIGSIPGRFIALSTLESSKHHLTHSLLFPIPISNAIAAFLSNLISSFYFVPLEVISQRLMVQGLPGTMQCNGPFDTFRKVMKREGIRGLYRGLSFTVLTQSPASALWWGSYAASQSFIWSLTFNERNKRASNMEMVTVQATAGMFAGAVSSVVTTPIDTVKTRLQVMDEIESGEGRPSVVKTAKTLVKEEGWRGLYRGFVPRFFNMSLYGTTMIVTYELIKRLSVKREMRECSSLRAVTTELQLENTT